MKRGGAALLAGLLFGVGLGVSGMISPAKVLGFLDVAGAWDPSLAFVMAGAIGVHLPLMRFIRRRPAPLFGSSFRIASGHSIDRRLVVGAALFGAGWGIAGYCPGPSIVNLATLELPVLAFVGAMLVGMLIEHRFWSPRPAAAAVPNAAQNVDPCET